MTLECLDVLDVREPGRVTASRVPGCAVPAPTDVTGTGAQTDPATPAEDGAGASRTGADGTTPQ